MDFEVNFRTVYIYIECRDLGRDDMRTECTDFGTYFNYEEYRYFKHRKNQDER
jgi:hypothetical protein